jgi:hypothetical protein
MPNYVNTVLPHSASKTHNIYLLSLYDIDQTIMSLMQMSYGSSLSNHSTTKLFPSYVWDLYELANKLPGPVNTRFDHRVMDVNKPWKQLLANRFTDDAGSEVYRRVSSFLPITLENSPSYTSQTYSGNFSFSPLINIGISDYDYLLRLAPSYVNYLNDQSAAEMVVYLASKVPLFPLMICSSINSHYSFGPIFLNNISFSVKGGESLGAVSIDCNFVGGKILMSPDVTLFSNTNPTRAAKRKPGIEPIIYNEMNDLDGNPIEENASNLATLDYDYHRYRSASLLDFVVDFAFHRDYLSLKAKVDTYKNLPPVYKITDFSMSINQNVDMQFTNPYTDTYKRDDIGPKFASLMSREVSGSVTYFCFNKTLQQPNSSGLSVYFGGPFFYAMENVDWSNPSVSIQPGGGYSHTYKWKARVPQGTYLPTNDLNKNMSEFSGSQTVSITNLINEITNNLFGIIK